MASDVRRPLSPPVLYILLALSDGAAHGYAIKQEVEARSEGGVRLGPGTLYGAIQRLLDAQLVKETTGQEAANGQEAQRRYYALTAQGRRLLKDELAHLGRLLAYARGKREPA